MKRISMWTLVFLLFLIVGCGKTGSTSPHINGLIYSIHEKSILVVEDIESADIPEVEWQGKPAYSVKITSNTVIQDESDHKLEHVDLIQGDHIQVWHTGTILESYPMQVTAEKIIIISK